MTEGKLPISSKELLGRAKLGAAREFRGDAAEGKRADALNHATGYAFSAGVDLDSVPTERRHVMAHAETIDFLSANDFTQQMTRVIYATKDPERQIAGYGYITRKEADIPEREGRVMKLAMGNVVIQDASTIFELNFDAPWHKGEAYQAILTDGMHDMLTEFFEHNQEAALMMYVNAEDVASDGAILKNLGAVAVGKDIYLNKPDHGIPEDNRKDTVFVVNKVLFNRSLQTAGQK